MSDRYRIGGRLDREVGDALTEMPDGTVLVLDETADEWLVCEPMEVD